MAHINKILELFKEERYRNSIPCNVFGDGYIVSIPKEVIINKFKGIENSLNDYFQNPNNTILIFKRHFDDVILKAKSLTKNQKGELKELFEQPIFLSLEDELNPALFRYSNTSIRLKLPNSNKSIDRYRTLFWGIHENSIPKELIKLEIGPKSHFFDSLEIGYGDDIIAYEFKGEKIEDIGKKLESDAVFKSSIGDIIFVETFPGNSNQSFRIHGLNRRIDIIIQNNKWIISRIQNKDFSKKPEILSQLNVAIHPSISFVEASKAKDAYETIKAEEAKGNTLISLWKIYSAIELERANQLKEKIGELSFSRIRFLPDGITRIRINNLSEELKISIKENTDDLLNTSFELSKEEESNNNDNKRYLIKSISNDFSFELYDELSSIPEKGRFIISLVGDEIVNKRREWALKSLRENRKFVTQNLLFAIEGSSEAMLPKKRKEKALTERTRKFLIEKFGINDLTPNQKEAVEIAINTPDIAIIQGPPGTGKSTVVAAICDRLIEIEEKNVNSGGNEFANKKKLILVSAFQNDTVEHIASKIYTLGLPTIKIGKETQSNIRAEDKLIEEMKLCIDDSLQRLSLKGTSNRLSKKLNDIKSVYLAEKKEDKLKQEIDAMVNNLDSDELWNEWKELTEDKKL